MCLCVCEQVSADVYLCASAGMCLCVCVRVCVLLYMVGIQVYKF